jgi:hypothetical protein
MKERFESPGKSSEKKFNPAETVLHIENNIRTESHNEVTAETYSFFKDLLTANGYTEFTDVNAAYSTLPASPLIVRREDPRNVLKLFSETESYEVGFMGDDRYSNCVEWNPQSDGPRNIGNAYAEGFTNLNNVVTVIGLEKAPEDDLLRLPDAVQDFHGLDRAGVRSFQGAVSAEKIVFISVRVPGHLFPESELTEEEYDKVDEYLESAHSGIKAQPVMIHRSYIKKGRDTEQRKEAA